MRLRLGIVGGGFITQIAHLPSLLALADRFEIVGLADPSLRVRETLTARYGIPASFDGHERLLEAQRPDALLVASPGSTHARVIADALTAEAHVFTEKPLCLTAEDADKLARMSASAGRVLQVGYMKRYDPACEQMFNALGATDGALRMIDGVTYDPGLERFFSTAATTRGDDTPKAVRDAARRREAEQVGRAVGAEHPHDVRAYVDLFCDSLVHDVNLLGGVLRAIGQHEVPRVVDASWWADGHAGMSVLGLDDDARCTLSFLELPGLSKFQEELSVYFDDAVHTLRFPAPYVRHAPTLYEHVAEQGDRSRKETWESWTESFVAELSHFHDCVCHGAACRTPPEQAAWDLDLLERIFRAGLASRPAPPRHSAAV